VWFRNASSFLPFFTPFSLAAGEFLRGKQKMRSKEAFIGILDLIKHGVPVKMSQVRKSDLQ
jgi:hypothetical protein